MQRDQPADRLEEALPRAGSSRLLVGGGPELREQPGGLGAQCSGHVGAVAIDRGAQQLGDHAVGETALAGDGRADTVAAPAPAAASSGSSARRVLPTPDSPSITTIAPSCADARMQLVRSRHGRVRGRPAAGLGAACAAGTSATAGLRPSLIAR